MIIINFNYLQYPFLKNPKKHTLSFPPLLRHLLRRFPGILFLLLQQSKMCLLVCTLHLELVTDFLEGDTFTVSHGDYVIDPEDYIDTVFLYLIYGYIDGEGTCVDAFWAYCGKDFIDHADSLLVFDYVAIFGRDQHQVEPIQGDIQENMLIGLDVGVLLGGAN